LTHFVKINNKKTYIDKGRLDLSSKGIQSFDKINGFLKTKDVRILDLSDNSLSSLSNLPDAFIQNNSKSLTKLYLSRNKIEKIEKIGQFFNLEELDLSHNKINKIMGLFSLENLISLNLSKNPIEKIEGMGNLKQLKTLWLKETKINHELIDKIGGIDKEAGLVENPQNIIQFCEQNKDIQEKFEMYL